MPQRGAGRQSQFVMPDSHRLKIANSNILRYLIEHAVGKREMSQTQAMVGIALMRKVLPDLSAIDATVTHHDGDLKGLVESLNNGKHIGQPKRETQH